MISYCKKNRFVKIKISWFGYKRRPGDIFSFNAHFHLKDLNGTRVPGIRNDSHTIEIDLTQDEETIFANLAKQVKQQYKTSEKEGIQCYLHNDRDRFVSFFNDFATKRKTYPTSKERLEEMGENLVLSFAEKDGVLLVGHSYLLDREAGIVRVHHSATARLDESFDKNLVGRAHKYMMVKNFLGFKEQGFKIFDMGGYALDTTDEGLKGINRFKEMFGGKVVTCINYYSYNYWLFKKISKALGMASEV